MPTRLTKGEYTVDSVLAGTANTAASLTAVPGSFLCGLELESFSNAGSLALNGLDSRGIQLFWEPQYTTAITGGTELQVDFFCSFDAVFNVSGGTMSVQV